MKTKLTVLFVPSEHSMVGDLRCSSLNKDFELVFPHEMSRDDFMASVKVADIIVADVTNITRYTADVISLALEYERPLITICATYSQNVMYRTFGDLVGKIQCAIENM